MTTIMHLRTGVLLEWMNKGAKRKTGPVEKQFWRRFTSRGWDKVALDLRPNQGAILVIPLKEEEWMKQSETPIWVSVHTEDGVPPYHLYVVQAEGHAQPDCRSKARQLLKIQIFPK